MFTFKFSKVWILLLPMLFTLTACMSTPQPLTDKNSNLTQGNVELNLKKGVTTKAEVLEKFGSPNVTTRDSSGNDVWTYQRSAQVAQSSAKSGYWTILLAGQSGKSSGFESSSRMMTLIIKFNKNDVVSDFSSRASDF
ncbi:MAG: hypothetical protein K0R12_1364 [Gammaproteobacteria bacterium]|jgi:outer membrane protein assembly factor BamE (lipoprotein component of BamABCDE complex)|nr:hypothetical protein [Gammaproteobacteria bacterium]